MIPLVLPQELKRPIDDLLAESQSYLLLTNLQAL